MIIENIIEYIISMWYEKNMKCIESIPWIWKDGAVALTIFFIDLMGKWIQRWEVKKVKAYTWLDPLDKESWESLNKTSISKRWNKKIRSLIYLWTMTWLRQVNNEKYKDTTIWKFTQRMQNKFIKTINWKRKWWKRVICAVESKLITTAWAMFWDCKAYNWS